jgi:hypothetical protein
MVSGTGNAVSPPEFPGCECSIRDDFIDTGETHQVMQQLITGKEEGY